MEQVRCIAYDSDRNLLAVGLGNSTIRLWDCIKKEWITVLSHEGAVTAMIFSEDGQYLLSAGSPTELVRTANTIKMWRIKINRELDLVCVDMHLMFSRSLRDTKFVVFDTDFRQDFRVHSGTEIVGLKYSPDPADLWKHDRPIEFPKLTLIASASTEEVCLWRCNIDEENNDSEEVSCTVVQVAQLTEAVETLTCIEFSNDGTFLIAGTEQGSVYLWKIGHLCEIDKEYIPRKGRQKTSKVKPKEYAREIILDEKVRVSQRSVKVFFIGEWNVTGSEIPINSIISVQWENPETYHSLKTDVDLEQDEIWPSYRFMCVTDNHIFFHRIQVFSANFNDNNRSIYPSYKAILRNTTDVFQSSGVVKNIMKQTWGKAPLVSASLSAKIRCDIDKNLDIERAVIQNWWFSIYKIRTYRDKSTKNPRRDDPNFDRISRQQEYELVAMNSTKEPICFLEDEERKVTAVSFLQYRKENEFWTKLLYGDDIGNVYLRNFSVAMNTNDIGEQMLVARSESKDDISSHSGPKSFGHKMEISSVLLTKDELILTGSLDHTVVIRDADNIENTGYRLIRPETMHIRRALQDLRTKNGNLKQILSFLERKYFVSSEHVPEMKVTDEIPKDVQFNEVDEVEQKIDVVQENQMKNLDRLAAKYGAFDNRRTIGIKEESDGKSCLVQ